MSYLRQRTDGCWGKMVNLHEPFTEIVKFVNSLDRNEQKYQSLINKCQEAFKTY